MSVHYCFPPRSSLVEWINPCDSHRLCWPPWRESQRIDTTVGATRSFAWGEQRLYVALEKSEEERLAARSPRCLACSERLATAGRYSRFCKKSVVARYSRLHVIGQAKSRAHPRYRQEKHKKQGVGTAAAWSVRHMVMDVRDPRSQSSCLNNLEDPVSASNDTDKDLPLCMVEEGDAGMTTSTGSLPLLGRAQRGPQQPRVGWTSRGREDCLEALRFLV